jgi:hypothetical protein
MRFGGAESNPAVPIICEVAVLLSAQRVPLSLACVERGAQRGNESAPAASYIDAGPRALIESDSVRSPSTTLFNAQATYRINHTLGLRVDAFNILDTRAGHHVLLFVPDPQ